MRALFAAAVLLGACAGGRATARGFVENVYRAHDPNKAAAAPWEADRCAATFSTRMCGLLEADRREAGDEVPRLDGDPLYDGQEFEITDLHFAGSDRSVEVTFKNFGQPRRVLLTLVKERGGWRIDEIDYRHDKPETLTQILTGPR